MACVVSKILRLILASFLVGAVLLITPDYQSFVRAAALKEARMELKSSAFESGAAISRKHTCDGGDISPELTWRNVPANAKRLALIVDDPDAPGTVWVHWVFYDLPASAKDLQEAIGKTEKMANGAKQGRNDFDRIGYGGPCPPPGNPHHYIFKLYALDQPTDLKPGATKTQLLAAIKGHILATAELIGRYHR